jgi:hypothetical protein
MRGTNLFQRSRDPFANQSSFLKKVVESLFWRSRGTLISPIFVILFTQICGLDTGKVYFGYCQGLGPIVIIIYKKKTNKTFASRSVAITLLLIMAYFFVSKCLFLCVRAPPIPTDHKIHIMMTARKAANQKILNDNKKFNNLVNCQLWDSMVKSINQANVFRFLNC